MHQQLQDIMQTFADIRNFYDEDKKIESIGQLAFRLEVCENMNI